MSLCHTDLLTLTKVKRILAGHCFVASTYYMSDLSTMPIKKAVFFQLQSMMSDVATKNLSSHTHTCDLSR